MEHATFNPTQDTLDCAEQPVEVADIALRGEPLYLRCLEFDNHFVIALDSLDLVVISDQETVDCKLKCNVGAELAVRLA